MHAEERPLDEPIGALPIGKLLSNSNVLIIPDRIVEHGGVLAAAFRPETQALRVLLSEAGLTVELAVPETAKKVLVEEHDATWVLPAVLVAATIPPNIVSTVIANWLSQRIDAHRSDGHQDRVDVRYREIDFDTQLGKGTIREYSGPVDDVIQMLRERSK